MTYLHDELAKRELPPLLTMNNGSPCIPGTWRKRRLEILDILHKNIYGYTPKAPDTVRSEVVESDESAFAGKVIQKKIQLTFDTPKGEFSFPFYLMLPKNVENPSAFLHIAFRSDIPDKYMPVEEITDNGFAIAMFCYNDVAKDSLDGNYGQGMAEMYSTDNPRQPDEWGKIGMWAFAASRVMDYLCTSGEVNKYRVAVIGHSRLGKTALWAVAQDERFYMAISNNSGFGGAALSKRGTGERVADFMRAGSWDWFCETFKKYFGKEDENNVYDQHMLLAAIVPRKICIGSAAIDRGADPKSEFLSCLSVNEVYELLGHYGFVTPDEYPKAPAVLFDGKVGYHIREGLHYFSRTDWLRYMEFFK